MILSRPHVLPAPYFCLRISFDDTASGTLVTEFTSPTAFLAGMTNLGTQGDAHEALLAAGRTEYRK